MAKLSELQLYKPTLNLDDKTQELWSRELVRAYPLPALLLALEQIKHGESQWINFGTIATEARRQVAATSAMYTPNFSPDRINISSLRKLAGIDSQGRLTGPGG